MLGLFGTLSLANRSLQAHQEAAEVAGHNLANVNNPGYSRQRAVLQTAPTVTDYALGPQGTGVDVVAITQIRDAIVDRQIQAETSVGGYLETRQAALEDAQAAIGQQVDRTASGSDAQTALAENISGFFKSFSKLSAEVQSQTLRQGVIFSARSLADEFTQVTGRLDSIRTGLNTQLGTQITAVNKDLKDIAQLNQSIANTELATNSTANDLRDIRQQKIEDLAKYVRIETAEGDNGSINITVAGTELVHGEDVQDTLELYDAGSGQMLVRAARTGTSLALTGGSLAGAIDVRDGELAHYQNDLDTLASNLITEVNKVHSAAYAPDGSTGTAFFLGTNARTIQVNPALVSNPSKIQASADADAPGNNKAALAISQLGTAAISALQNQTFIGHYSETVSHLGQALADTNNDISDQQVVANMYKTQRESISGVSLDEEMTDLIRFQKAYQASAKLLTTIDEMLDTVLSLKR